MATTSIERFFGGAVYHTAGGGARTLTYGMMRRQRVQTGLPTADMDYTLPDARLLPLGGPIFYLMNLSLLFDYTLKDFDGNTLATIKGGDGVGGGQGQVARMYLVDNSTSAGVWIADIRDGINF